MLQREADLPQILQVQGSVKEWYTVASKYNLNYSLIAALLLQVRDFSNKQKFHRGQIFSERRAAQIYDKRTILTKGLNARTNFNYTKKQIEGLLDHDDDSNEPELLRKEPKLLSFDYQSEQKYLM